MEKQVCQQQKDIYATFPRDSTIEFLLSCRKVGAAGIRIHTAKMLPSQVVELLKRSKAADLQTMVDLPGIKGRTKQSPDMLQDDTPGETGNWYLPLAKGDEFFLAPQHILKEDLGQLGKQAVLSSVVPKQLETGDLVEFADGKIVCQVTNAQEINGDRVLEMRVHSIRDTKGIYWNMGFGSSTTDLLTGHPKVITYSDEMTLSQIATKNLQREVDKVAISFVSHPAHLAEAAGILGFYRFDLQHTSIVAKIETLEAVKNMKAIAEEILRLKSQGINIIVEIGRGDLGDDCRAKGRSLEEIQSELIALLLPMEIPIIIATDIARSTIHKFRSDEEISLDHGERSRLIREVLVGITSWMLAAETMITGYKAIDVIRVVSDTICRGHKIMTYLESKSS